MDHKDKPCDDGLGLIDCGRYPRKKALMRLRRRILTQPHPHIDTCLLQQRRAAPIYAGIGIYDGDETLRDASVNERISARRGLSVMAARFERDIGSCAASLLPCDLERDSFGMGAAAVLRGALSNNFPVFDEDTADSGVFRRTARLRRAKIEGAPHIVFMRFQSAIKHSSFWKKAQAILWPEFRPNNAPP